jgi:hypothetical protein
VTMMTTAEGLASRLQDAKSIHTSKLQVTDDQAVPRRVLRDFSHRSVSVQYRRHGMAAVSEVFDEEIGDVGFLIDDQNVQGSGSRLGHGDCATPRARLVCSTGAIGRMAIRLSAVFACRPLAVAMIPPVPSQSGSSRGRPFGVCSGAYVF